MMTTILFVLLVILVSIFVMQPLIKPIHRRKHAKASSNHVAGDLLERKETIYAAIREIEFDYQMGKLSEEDFQQLRQQYKDEAIAVLQRLDKAQGKKAKKASGRNSPADQGVAKFCSQCGTAVTKNDKFCSACGSNLA